jgi:hypothetical protein
MLELSVVGTENIKLPKLGYERCLIVCGSVALGIGTKKNRCTLKNIQSSYMRLCHALNKNIILICCRFSLKTSCCLSVLGLLTYIILCCNTLPYY